jgi:hypothetical protein
MNKIRSTTAVTATKETNKIGHMMMPPWTKSSMGDWPMRNEIGRVICIGERVIRLKKREGNVAQL